MAGSLLNAIAFFSAAPFLTLYLSANSHLSLPVIGAVVGSVALVAAVGGVVGRHHPSTARAPCAGSCSVS